MHIAHVVAAFFKTDLANRLKERQRLNVTDRSANFDDGNIGTVGTGLDLELDLIGDVRNNLNRFAEILATTLFFEHGVVNLTGREVIALGHLGAGEALVMPQIEIGLGAVLGDENLSMLERTHRAGVDVDVGVKLEVGDFNAAGFQNGPERCGGDAFAQ